MSGISLCRWFSLASLVIVAACSGCQSPGGRRGADVEIVESHWPDGQVRMRVEKVRDSSGALIEHGKYQTWHPNGTLAYEATYVDGKLDGAEVAYHENGQRRAETHYVRGERHGRRRTWDQKGNLRGEEYYVDDKPDGTWTIWKDNGKVKWRGRFDHGKPLP